MHKSRSTEVFSVETVATGWNYLSRSFSPFVAFMLAHSEQCAAAKEDCKMHKGRNVTYGVNVEIIAVREI
jgi:hypothetical protein